MSTIVPFRDDVARIVAPGRREVVRITVNFRVGCQGEPAIWIEVNLCATDRYPAQPYRDEDHMSSHVAKGDREGDVMNDIICKLHKELENVWLPACRWDDAFAAHAIGKRVRCAHSFSHKSNGKRREISEGTRGTVTHHTPGAVVVMFDDPALGSCWIHTWRFSNGDSPFLEFSTEEGTA